MRDILFRAKRIDNDEWVYGYYIKTHDYLDNREIHLIVGIDSTSFPANEITDTNEIDPETLGEFTGVTDKNGVKIFEGDIFEREVNDGEKKTYVVEWSREYLGLVAKEIKCKPQQFEWIRTRLDLLARSDLEVIGNIYEGERTV